MADGRGGARVGDGGRGALVDDGPLAQRAAVDGDLDRRQHDRPEQLPEHADHERGRAALRQEGNPARRRVVGLDVAVEPAEEQPQRQDVEHRVVREAQRQARGELRAAAAQPAHGGRGDRLRERTVDAQRAEDRDALEHRRQARAVAAAQPLALRHACQRDAAREAQPELRRRRHPRADERRGRDVREAEGLSLRRRRGRGGRHRAGPGPHAGRRGSWSAPAARPRCGRSRGRRRRARAP